MEKFIWNREKFNDIIVEIENWMSKLKSHKNLRAKFNLLQK